MDTQKSDSVCKFRAPHESVSTRRECRRTLKTGLIVFLLALGGCAYPHYKDGQPLIGELRIIGENVRLNGQRVTDYTPLYQGDRLATGKDSSVYLYFRDDNGFVQLDENTDPAFRQILQGTRCFFRMLGQLAGISYYESGKGKCGLVFSNLHADAVRQGTRANFAVDADRTVITVLEGRMNLTRPRRVSVEAGLQIRVTPQGAGDPVSLSPAQLEDVVKWRRKFKLRQASAGWPHRFPEPGRPPISPIHPPRNPMSPVEPTRPTPNPVHGYPVPADPVVPPINYPYMP